MGQIWAKAGRSGWVRLIGRGWATWVVVGCGYACRSRGGCGQVWVGLPFCNNLLGWGGVFPLLPEISRTTIYQMLVSIRSHKIKKKIDITRPVCKLQTKIRKNPNFRNANSRHTNFAIFSRIVTIVFRNEA